MLLKRLLYLIVGITLASVTYFYWQDSGTDLWGKDMRAVEFPAQTRWLNTEDKITLASLRGRVVVLDFWTYCCINCLHTLPRLAELEKIYADKPLTVLGIHSGKFEQERSDEKVRQAIEKYEIHHPVAMDDDFSIWNRWGVRAWPTLVFIDTDGNVAGSASGEPDIDELKRIVDSLLEGRAVNKNKQGKSTASAIHKEVFSTSALRYPGKVILHEGRIFIADSGRHRIVVADAGNGQILNVYGGDDAGFTDGSASEARFNQPQGMAVHNGVLYVADRNNHAIRAVELNTGNVSTVAGSGRKASWRMTGGIARNVDMRSPWDLVLRGDGLDVAMAGSHQIWRYEFISARLYLLAGSGIENIIDGGFEKAAFAQPSGLWFSGDGELFVADSETSAVRKLNLKSGLVETLVGTGLFDFGLRDGPGRTAQLQHPLGITGNGRILYVADSFNNVIRSINIDDGVIVKTLDVKGVGRLNEPSGMALSGKLLFVADTNNHRIVKVDLDNLHAEEFILHERDSSVGGSPDCIEGQCSFR